MPYPRFLGGFWAAIPFYFVFRGLLCWPGHIFCGVLVHPLNGAAPARCAGGGGRQTIGGNSATALRSEAIRLLGVLSYFFILLCMVAMRAVFQ